MSISAALTAPIQFQSNVAEKIPALSRCTKMKLLPLPLYITSTSSNSHEVETREPKEGSDTRSLELLALQVQVMSLQSTRKNKEADCRLLRCLPSSVGERFHKDELHLVENDASAQLEPAVFTTNHLRHSKLAPQLPKQRLPVYQTK